MPEPNPFSPALKKKSGRLKRMSGRRPQLREK